MTASALIADVRNLLRGSPVYLAGSLVAAETYGKNNAHHDVDLFCPTPQVLISTGQKLLDAGFKLDDRFSRVWERWLRYGFKTWHTNSLRMHDAMGTEYNLVYKLTDGHPTTSLGQVLESFDFGLLATGYDLECGSFRDMRGYLFPGLDPDGPLPMMPNKRSNWRNGFISQYNGLREIGRYAKYHGYGYDMSAVKDDLATGYMAAASYFTNAFDADKQQLGKIYEVCYIHIEDDNIDQLAEAAKLIDYKDSLDKIMEALE
jgi:hypothetical protein